MFIYCEYGGRLGNQLSAYCAARHFSDLLRRPLYAGPIEGFSGATAKPVSELPRPGKPYAPLYGNCVDPRFFEALAPDQPLHMHGWFNRYEYFKPNKEHIRSSWLVRECSTPSDEGHLTIHVRCGDVWAASNRKVHPEYHALPWSFYENILNDLAWSAVTIVTEDPYDPMVQKLAARSNARIQSSTPLDDFDFIRKSANIVLSVSSFSWWAAWLSQARRIYFPVIGFYDERRARLRPPHMRQDLRVDDEERYIYIDLNCTSPWTGTQADRQRLLES